MRLILRHRPSLHVWNVGDYLKQTHANIVKQDTNKYITLQRIFRKIYLRHLSDHESLKAHQKSLDNFVLLSPAPARAITDYFHRKSKEFSEDFLRATLEAVARAYQISKVDHSGSLDTLGYKLFLSSEFCNLSEELKFALRNNKLSFETVASVLDSLVRLEYVDHELVHLLLLYTRRELEGGDPYALLKDWPGDREFQIEKHGYYDPQEAHDLQALRGSQEVATAISFVRHIYREWTDARQMDEELARCNIEELNALVEEISSTNRNFRRLVESIISIRRQYLQMVQFSQQEQVLRNPNLNLDLLDLEEKLLATRLLTIEDVKNPSGIADAEDEVRRVEEVLLRVLDIRRLDPVFAFVDKASVEVVAEKEEQRASAARASLLLNGLARLAELDRHVYHAQDGKSLVSLRWEKTLVPQYQGKRLPGSLHEELNTARIFRRVYREVFEFVAAREGRLSELFKGSVLADRVELADALCRLGLNEQAVGFMEKLSESAVASVGELPPAKFASLLHVLNNIGIFVSSDALHSAVKDRLAAELEQEEQNREPRSIRFSIDAANYLLQVHRAGADYSRLSGQILRLLEAKATYVTHEQRENEEIVEAFRILALERPERFGAHPIYLHYLHRIAHDDYKRNPFAAIIRETAFRWAGKEGALKALQNYLPLGVNLGVPNGLLLSGSDETSLDGEIRSGDLNSYIVRLELKNGVKLNELAVNSLLSINYGQEKAFRLRPLDLLRGRLEEIFEHQPEEFDQLYQTICSNLRQILAFYTKSTVSDRIEFKLAVLRRLRSNSSSIHTEEQELSNKASFLLEVLELGKLVSLLDDKLILSTVARPKQPNAPLNDSLRRDHLPREEPQTIEVDVEGVRLLIKETRNAMPEFIESLSRFMGQEAARVEKKEARGLLRGERQSIEMLEEGAGGRPDLTLELVNLRYYNDKTYCEYEDWKERISNKFHYSELHYDSASNLTKILANKLCGDVTNKLNLLPLVKHEDRVQRLDIEFKVFPKELPEDEAEEGREVRKAGKEGRAGKEGKAAERETDYIINLQNFKHELKTFYSPSKLVDYIFGFKFVSELGMHAPEKERLVMRRDPQEYFNYLEQLHEKSYLESPYAQYIISKLGRTDRIRELLEQRKDLRASLRIQYQKGLIDGNEYYSRVNAFENSIIAALEDLKGKLLDHMPDTLLRSEFKMVSIRKEELEAFEELLNRQIGYSRHFDEDFIYANGDYHRALQLKRGRAQNNYVRLALLKKMGEDQLLDAREKLQLKKWHEDITRSVTEFVVYPEYTTLQVADLSWEDMQHLKLRHSALNANKDMLVIDLILELTHFLDDALLLAYEREVKAEFIHKHFKVPPCLFERTANPSFRRLEVETEVAIANEQARLAPHELDKVEEMFKVYKSQGFRERQRYAVLCKRFRSNIEDMNAQPIRNELIQEYVRYLEVEFYKEYDPSLVADIKERETDKLWRSVFQQTYDGCNKDLLRDITKKLILRLEAIGENSPPFFGNMLLKLLLHPNLDSHSRESLIVAIEINQFDLNLDSADIEMISRLPGKGLRSSEETRAALRASSSVKVSKYLRAKAAAVQ